jgi:hypothetical protein
MSGWLKLKPLVAFAHHAPSCSDLTAALIGRPWGVVAFRYQGWIHRRLAEDPRNDSHIGLQVRFLAEDVGHWKRVRVVEAEVVHAEDIFHGAQDIGGVVIGVDTAPPMVVQIFVAVFYFMLRRQGVGGLRKRLPAPHEHPSRARALQR